MRPFNFGQTLTDRHAEMERRDRVGVGVGEGVEIFKPNIYAAETAASVTQCKDIMQQFVHPLARPCIRRHSKSAPSH